MCTLVQKIVRICNLQSRAECADGVACMVEWFRLTAATGSLSLCSNGDPYFERAMWASECRPTIRVNVDMSSGILDR